MLQFEREQREWLATEFEELTTELIGLSPSAWAEAKRYLPPSVTSLPGFYRFEVAPYLREILDCLSVESPIREISVMKGAQIGVTVGVLENCIGYLIDHVKTAPVMLVTADAELAKLRMESYITPMLQLSGLEHLIKSADETNTRKTGKTDKKLEWTGGGYLVPFGAQNANKLRSLSIQYLLDDEIDGWPDVVGKDGDPIKLVRDRTAAYEGSRKILDISTPLIKGTSKIAKRFEHGDQRRYFVCCLKCGFSQTLRWRRTNPATGEITGIVWETQNGRLVPDSVRYLCENCSHEHFNDDKTRLLSPENGAEWRPTEEPQTPHHRSYHLNALYSPVGMQTWTGCVAKWLDAWDVETDRPRDLGELQVFYNNVLGEPFELRGQRVKLEAVSEHKRACYIYGQLPNAWALEHCGSPILLVTCAVDVHKESLRVAVFGWCRARRAFLLDYWKLDGDTEQLDDPGTWGRLREIIETHRYVADDGKRYAIQVTLIDSGYLTDQVYRFCAEYQAGVFPVKGRDAPPKNATLKEFGQFTTPNGVVAYSITVDLYKDRWSASLRRSWDGQSQQPTGHFNVPRDATDKQLKELTVEVKRERIEKDTGRRIGFEWFRPSGAANELWDLLVYNDAARDLVGWDLCRSELKLEATDWALVDELLEREKRFFEEPTKDGGR
jgi:phage terminase large subunit GpA-like protein